MKLTNTLRDAFVRAVMADVPIVDYQQQGRTLALKHAVEVLPPKVRAIWDDPKLQSHIWQDTWWSRDYLIFCTRVPLSHDTDFKPTPEVMAELDKLQKLHDAQEKSYNDLRISIRSVALSVTTRQALADALPEFEKYLPADEAKANRLLPCVQNVVASFIKAGWPKGQEPKVSAGTAAKKSRAKRLAIKETA